MQAIQKRWKAVLATLGIFISDVWAFYQAHQSVTLKQFVMSVIAAVIGGAIVHQIPNQETK